MKKSQTFLQGSVILIASVLITKAVGALFKLPLVNILGGTLMGIFSCAYSIFIPVYSVCTIGLSTAVCKLIAENEYDNKYILKSSLALFTLIGLVFSALLFIFNKEIAYIIGSTNSAGSIKFIAPAIFFGCITSVYRGYFEGLKDMTPTAVSNVIEGIIKLIFGLGFAIYLPKHFNVNPAEGAIIGITLSCLAGMIYLWILYIFSHKENCKTKKTKHITKRLIAIALPISLTILVTNMTSLIDLFTIIRGLPVGDNPDFLYGCFAGLAVTLFNLVPTITNMFGKSAFPHIAEAIKCKRNAKKHIEDVLLSTAFIAVPCGVFLYLLSNPILRFLFYNRAAEVSASEQSLAYLGLSVVFVSLCYPLFLILQAADKAFLTTEIMFAGVVIKYALNVILIKEIGITGAAISTFATYFVMCILSYSALRKYIGISLNLRRIFFAPMYAGVLCAVTVIISKSVISRFFIFGDSVWDMFLILSGCGIAGGGIYIFAMYLLTNIRYTLTRNERSLRGSAPKNPF